MCVFTSLLDLQDAVFVEHQFQGGRARRADRVDLATPERDHDLDALAASFLVHLANPRVAVSHRQRHGNGHDEDHSAEARDHGR